MDKTLKPGWSYKKLDELGFVGRGKSKYRPRNDPSLYGGEYPFIQTGEVKAADLYISKYSQTYSEKGLAQSKLWEPGTLLLTIAANIADTAILKIKACFPDSIVGFIADPDEADVRFVKYYIDTIKLHMQSISRGTTQDNLSLEKIRSFDFKTPPLSTQRKIAAILSAYDDLIENNTRRIEILEEMARSLYREWFVNFRFPGHEQVKMVDSNSEFGLIPEGWEVLPINELIKRGILEKNQDGNHGEKHPKSTDYLPAGIPFIMAKDLSNNILDLVNCQFISNEQAQSLRVGFAKRGDVLLTHKATMGRVAIVPQVENFIVLTPQVTYFRIKDYSSLNQAFLYCTFTSDRFQDILSGQSEQSTRKFISITNQRNIIILYPNPDWISKFGVIINDFLNLKQSLYSKNINLRQTCDLLLPKLISGEIDLEKIEISTVKIAA